MNLGAVSSLYSLEPGAMTPSRNSGRLSRSNVSDPRLSLIPYSLTIRRTILVARNKSFWAPGRYFPKTISSAALPPRSTLILSITPNGSSGSAPLSEAAKYSQGRNSLGDDGNLVNRIGCGKRFRNQSMTGFMIGDNFLLLLINQAVLFFPGRPEPVDSFFEIGHFYGLLAFASRKKRCLIDYVGDIGTHHARGPGRQNLQIDSRRKLHLLRQPL